MKILTATTSRIFRFFRYIAAALSIINMYEVSRLPERGYPLLIIYSYLRFRHNLSEPIAKLVIGPNNSNFYEIHDLHNYLSLGAFTFFKVTCLGILGFYNIYCCQLIINAVYIEESNLEDQYRV